MWAMVIKEFVQMRRDRMTFATMIFVPIMQLVLFGYAINTNPKHLPTAVLVRDSGPLTRAVLATSPPGLAHSRAPCLILPSHPTFVNRAASAPRNACTRGQRRLNLFRSRPRLTLRPIERRA